MHIYGKQQSMERHETSQDSVMQIQCTFDSESNENFSASLLYVKEGVLPFRRFNNDLPFDIRHLTIQLNSILLKLHRSSIQRIIPSIRLYKSISVPKEGKGEYESEK
jgi:hypothetical protein